jgi:hypothetical protein
VEAGVDPVHLGAQLLADDLDLVAELLVAHALEVPARFSAIHSRAKEPSWISERSCFIAARDSGPITRLPRVRSPYSAVFEIEYRIPAIPFS